MKTSLSLKSTLAAACLCVVAWGSPVFAEGDLGWPLISATDASKLADHVGKPVVVEGVVKRAGRGPNDGLRFLNFEQDTRTGFVAAIFPVAYPGIDPVEEYVGKTVRVSGDLETYREQVQIKVSDPTQIEVVKDSTAAE